MVKTVQPQIERLVASTTSAPVQAHVTGQPTLDRAIKDEALATTKRAELIAVGLLFVLLLIGLRAPVAAFAAVGLRRDDNVVGHRGDDAGGQGDRHRPDRRRARLARRARAGRRVQPGDRSTASARSERLAPRDAALAATSAVASAGRAVLVSGTAMIVALVLAVAIAPTTILMSLGIGVLLCSMLATGAAVVVLPAVLTVLGRRGLRVLVPRATLPRARVGLARRRAAAGSHAEPCSRARWRPPRSWRSPSRPPGWRPGRRTSRCCRRRRRPGRTSSASPR